jgi:hypothetical protein
MIRDVIASEAKQSICASQRNNGLLRRLALLRKRFVFVAGNDGTGTQAMIRRRSGNKEEQAR